MVVFEVTSKQREAMIEITDRVQAAVRDSGLSDGLCVVYVPHTTAAVTINENADPDVRTDILGFLGKTVPRSSAFRHGEGNSDAHVKASLLGSSVSIPVAGGKLALGTWQGVFFAEFDGPRRRQACVQVLAG